MRVCVSGVLHHHIALASLVHEEPEKDLERVLTRRRADFVQIGETPGARGVSLDIDGL
jgi:hypothetical protein